MQIMKKQVIKDWIITLLGGMPINEYGELIFCATQVTLLAKRKIPQTFFYVKECEKVLRKVAPAFTRIYFGEEKNG